MPPTALSASAGTRRFSVQSMTAGYTYDVDACVAEINKLAAAGADIVRVAVPEKKDTAALKEILPQVTVPIVADVHFTSSARSRRSTRASTRSA
jgi:(E)-4-hydroxy-3-methylbut-2-enyl-diphosphate synthase